MTNCFDLQVIEQLHSTVNDSCDLVVAKLLLILQGAIAEVGHELRTGFRFPFNLKPGLNRACCWSSDALAGTCTSRLTTASKASFRALWNTWHHRN